MKLVQAFNYLLGSLFNSQKTYINVSLSYLKRNRKIDRNYMDYIRLSTLELVADEINSKNLEGSVAFSAQSNTPISTSIVTWSLASDIQK